MLIRLIVFIFLLVICIVAVVVVDTISHENAHKQISLYHGCIDYDMHYNFIGTSYFRCNEHRNRTQETALQEMELHSLNEIKSYNETKSIGFFSFGIILFLYITLVLKPKL